MPDRAPDAVRRLSRRGWGQGLALALCACVTGCAAAESQPDHRWAELGAVPGEGVSLRTDLVGERAAAALARLEHLQGVADAALPLGPAPLDAVVLGDAARFALAARDHRIEGLSAGFLCGAGELVLRAGSSADAASASWAPLVARRRLVVDFPGLGATTPLEEGVVRWFVERVDAPGAGAPAPGPDVRRLERLLDAYLPLFLGGSPGLTRAVEAPAAGPSARRGAGTPPGLAWAAATFLLAAPERTALLRSGLARHAGQPAAVPWPEARRRLAELESVFEGWLQREALSELLLGVARGARLVDRIEAAAALRLLTGLAVDPEAPAAARATAVGEVEALLRSELPPVRFLDRYRGEIAALAAARSRLRAAARLRKQAEVDLEHRARGYGHPAVERARRQLGRALERALQAGG